jgi:hypothetical protein
MSISYSAARACPETDTLRRSLRSFRSSTTTVASPVLGASGTPAWRNAERNGCSRGLRALALTYADSILSPTSQVRR